MRTPPFNSRWHGTRRAAATVLLSFLLSLPTIPTTSAFAWLWPAWLHAGHPLADARSRSPQPPGVITVAAASAASEPPQPSSGSDVCRPAYVKPPPPSNGNGAAPEQDWPELRSLLSGIHGEAEPALVDKGPTARAKPPRPPRRVRVDWWERALSPQLRTGYEMYYGEGRAYSTILENVRLLKRLFVEAAPAIFVEGEHTFAGDGRVHPVVDTGGVATALPLTTKEQLRAFLHRYHKVLEATARALPGRAGTGSLGALRQLTAFAMDGTPTGIRRRATTTTTTAAAAAAAAATAPRRHADLWSRLVSLRLEKQFQKMQRYRHRSEEAIAATLQTLPRLFARIPLEPYEEAVLLLAPFRTTEELRRFLRRHYFDMVDAAAGQDRAATTGEEEEDGGVVGAVEAEEAMAELWLFALIDRPDTVEWADRWKRHLEEVDAAAAREADLLAAEWEAIAARALGEVELAEERQRVLGEMVAWAQRVKEGRRNGKVVAGADGGQPALDAEEGGPGAVDALEGMVEAVREIQEEEKKGGKNWGHKGFGRPFNGNANGNGNGGQPTEGKRGGKKGFRRPWRRGQD